MSPWEVANVTMREYIVAFLKAHDPVNYDLFDHLSFKRDSNNRTQSNTHIKVFYWKQRLSN